MFVLGIVETEAAAEIHVEKLRLDLVDAGFVDEQKVGIFDRDFSLVTLEGHTRQLGERPRERLWRIADDGAGKVPPDRIVREQPNNRLRQIVQVPELLHVDVGLGGIHRVGEVDSVRIRNRSHGEDRSENSHCATIAVDRHPIEQMTEQKIERPKQIDDAPRRLVGNERVRGQTCQSVERKKAQARAPQRHRDHPADTDKYKADADRDDRAPGHARSPQHRINCMKRMRRDRLSRSPKPTRNRDQKAERHRDSSGHK